MNVNNENKSKKVDLLSVVINSQVCKLYKENVHMSICEICILQKLYRISFF